MFGLSVLGLICNITLILFPQFLTKLSFPLFSHFTISFPFRPRRLMHFNTPLIPRSPNYIPASPNSPLVIFFFNAPTHSRVGSIYFPYSIFKGFFPNKLKDNVTQLLLDPSMNSKAHFRLMQLKVTLTKLWWKEINVFKYSSFEFYQFWCSSFKIFFGVTLSKKLARFSIQDSYHRWNAFITPL